MGLFDFSKLKPKSTQELQAELKALHEKMKLRSDYYDQDDLDKYEELLKQLYLRGVKPKAFIRRKEGKSASVTGQKTGGRW